MDGEGVDTAWNSCWTAAFGKLARDIVDAAAGDTAVKRCLAVKMGQLAVALDCVAPGSSSRLVEMLNLPLSSWASRF